jgi:hypothetical protein
MALSPERIQELRAKAGIPAGGIGMSAPGGTPMLGANERIAKLQKMSQLRTEATTADTAATKAGSKIGIAKETVKEAGRKLASSVIKTGERLGETAATSETIAKVTGNTPVIEQVIEGEDNVRKTAHQMLRTIQANKKAGKDTARLEKAYNEIAGHTQDSEIENILPTLNDSNFDAVFDAVGVGLDALSGGAAAPAKSAIKEVTKSAAEVAGKVVKPVVEAAAKGRAARGAAKQLEYTLDLTMPKVTAKSGAEGIEQGRLVEPGILSKGKLTPTPHDSLVAESVQGIISSKKSLAENVDLISQKISETNLGVREMIATRKTPFNSNQLRTRLNAVKEENKLVFASDATAEKVYDAVVDVFMKNVEKKDTLGLFEARQTFDKIPAIKKLLQTEGLGENVKRQIVLDVRRAANEYVAEQLPKNNPYRKALMEESRMIEAIGNMAEKNVKSIGKNKLQLLMKEYPILQWFLGTAFGVGVSGAVINSF